MNGRDSATKPLRHYSIIFPSTPLPPRHSLSSLRRSWWDGVKEDVKSFGLCCEDALHRSGTNQDGESTQFHVKGSPLNYRCVYVCGTEGTGGFSPCFCLSPRLEKETILLQAEGDRSSMRQVVLVVSPVFTLILSMSVSKILLEPQS